MHLHLHHVTAAGALLFIFGALFLIFFSSRTLLRIRTSHSFFFLGVGVLSNRHKKMPVFVIGCLRRTIKTDYFFCVEHVTDMIFF
jgi:hypothetical protein